jgi:hypothetical protein
MVGSSAGSRCEGAWQDDASPHKWGGGRCNRTVPDKGPKTKKIGLKEQASRWSSAYPTACRCRLRWELPQRDAGRAGETPASWPRVLAARSCAYPLGEERAADAPSSTTRPPIRPRLLTHDPHRDQRRGVCLHAPVRQRGLRAGTQRQERVLRLAGPQTRQPLDDGAATLSGGATKRAARRRPSSLVL